MAEPIDWETHVAKGQDKSETPTPKLGRGRRFRPKERIRKSADFQRIYGTVRPVSDRYLRVFVCSNGLDYCRLGLSVGRRWGGAVKRNRYKRMLREAFRLSKSSLPVGYDLVIVPQAHEIPTLERIQKSLCGLVWRGADRAKP